MALNITSILDEIVDVLKNNDVISTTTRGITRATETFNGDGSTVEFDLTNDVVKNVKTISIGGTEKSFGTDYSIDYNSATTTVTFGTAPTNGTDNVSIQYDHSTSSDKIYPDAVRDDISSASLPRISVCWLGAESTPLGLGGDAVLTSPVLSISAYDRSEKKVNDYIYSIRDVMLTNSTAGYNYKCILPINIGPMLPWDNTKGDEILFRVADFRIYLEKE